MAAKARKQTVSELVRTGLLVEAKVTYKGYLIELTAKSRVCEGSPLAGREWLPESAEQSRRSTQACGEIRQGTSSLRACRDSSLPGEVANLHLAGHSASIRRMIPSAKITASAIIECRAGDGLVVSSWQSLRAARIAAAIIGLCVCRVLATDSGFAARPGSRYGFATE
jgi:hypothetical protein